MSLLGPIRRSKRPAFCAISTYSTATSSPCRIQLDRIRRRPFSDNSSSTRAAPPPPPPPVPENVNAESSRGGSSSSNEKQKQKSAHAQWYADTVPAMIPVALLGSVVYFALLLTQQKFSSEKYLDEANARIQALEAEIVALREKQLQNRTSSSSGTSQSALAFPGTAGDNRKSYWRSWW